MAGPFTRRPAPEASAFADAQSLLDAGLDADFVLALFSAEDRDRLAPLLAVARRTATSYESLVARPGFERRLRTRVLERARPATVGAAAIAPPAPATPRTALAAGAMAAAAIVGGVFAAGLMTAGDASPGDWNYVFKAAGERLDYNLSGDRIDIQLRHTEARVRELQRRLDEGAASVEDIERLHDEWSELASLVKPGKLDGAQQERLRELGDRNADVVARAEREGAAPGALADDTIKRAADVVAAGTGGTPITPPVATPRPEPTAAPAAEARPTQN